MNKNLMVIESPNKIKTISSFLKNDQFQLIATYGHLRDLSKFGIGFDKDLNPTWVYTTPSVKRLKLTKDQVKKAGKEIQKASKIPPLIEEIKQAAKLADKIYLSTDPDREGEAISWHVWSILDEKERKKCVRVVFNEITEKAVLNALENPRTINMNQVDSYLARRLLDREFGYKLSGFVKGFIGGFSAGRVQSVTLLFLCDREKEILAFVPESWFTIEVVINKNLKLTLRSVNPNFYNFALNSSVKDGKINFTTKAGAKSVFEQLKVEYQLIKIHDDKFEKIKAKKALKTSTLQQEAINRLKLSSRTVEKLVQKLYEGIEINKQMVSLITYPRTDRNDLSLSFIDDAKAYITKTYGANYYKEFKESKELKAKKPLTNLVQGAHEAIRPTNLAYPPEVVEPYLSKQEFQVYQLIWTTALGSLMSDSVYLYKYYDFLNNGCLFNTFSRTQEYDGFEKIYNQYSLKKNFDDEPIEANQTTSTNLQEAKKLVLNQNYLETLKTIEQHDKKPPSRYTEASLIKILEKMGIGRPSTYASIANTVINREYAQKVNNALVPTKLGIDVAEQLKKLFPKIISYNYTREMEEKLDQIADQAIGWKDFLRPVFSKFNEQLKIAKTTEKKIEVKYANELCPECQSELIYRKSYRRINNNEFIGCSNFPKCRYTRSLVTKPQPELLSESCPQCNASLIKRMNKRDQPFIGCSAFPKCRYIKKELKKTALADQKQSKEKRSKPINNE